MQVKLRVLSEVIDQSEYVFEEPGGFTFGRAPDCTCPMPASDNTFSRHHFLLEINPPLVMLKDLGSLNGTLVNGTKYGGRPADVEPGDAESSPALPLRDGDRIQAGMCILELSVDIPPVCVDCGKEIDQELRKMNEFVGGTYLCQECRELASAKKNAGQAPQYVDSDSADIKMDMSQRERAEKNPAGVLGELLGSLLRARDRNRVPTIRGYRDLVQIGEGGFGAVYRARRLDDGATVAIKTLLQTRRPTRRHKLMFEREKEIAKQLRHPNIVHCQNVSSWNEIHFIEMEYMSGGSVLDLMKRMGGFVPLDVAVPIMLDALCGLAHAHHAVLTVSLKSGPKTVKGVVHRDLKPSNILLSRQEGRWSAKLSDFGLAKAFSEAGFTKGAITADVGDCCGSIPYLAPEHLVNYRHVTPSTDVFELAASLYHMITGQVVWPFQPGVEPIRTVLEGRVRPIRKVDPNIPRSVATVFDVALSRNVSNRYQDGEVFRQAMVQALKSSM